MEKIHFTHGNRNTPLRRSNVDTIRLFPAVYLKRVTRSGFEDGLFAAWRNDPEFVLNKPEYAKASILVAGIDFGTGSSREHAVWAATELWLQSCHLQQICRHLPGQLSKRWIANCHTATSRD